MPCFVSLRTQWDPLPLDLMTSTLSILESETLKFYFRIMYLVVTCPRFLFCLFDWPQDTFNISLQAWQISMSLKCVLL